MITIEVPTTDAELFNHLAKDHPSEVTVVRVKKFQGQPDVTQILIALSSVVLPLVAKIIIEQIRAKKHISVKANGIEIKGMTEKNVLKVLKEAQAMKPSKQPAPTKKRKN